MIDGATIPRASARRSSCLREPAKLEEEKPISYNDREIRTCGDYAKAMNDDDWAPNDSDEIRTQRFFCERCDTLTRVLTAKPKPLK